MSVSYIYRYKQYLTNIKILRILITIKTTEIMLVINNNDDNNSNNNNYKKRKEIKKAQKILTHIHTLKTS